MTLLRVFNRQKTRKVDGRLLRKACLWALRHPLGETDFELAIHLVDPAEMTRMNESFLGHEGSTDVITFNNAEPGEAGLRGEIFISVADALQYARQFQTTWQAEVVRYALHGFLHLQGFDDHSSPERKTMKRHENRLLKAAAEQFDLDPLDLAPAARK